MLKRLELIGFKSFAEKTRFDFPSGITAIVGPNGSGKSNIVDAVRWILGEQSAKSLRGGEMADVIFNGSASRKSLGLAEVTMTFDNRKRSLNSDADEVEITRRVYRDGTGEYLINQQICRLKDIKDLFLGSGAGTSAYCIIEQGRVDALLQASTSERRTIFEEAAGISRFKAKKNEALRKLEHVDQNLEQLQLIISEVEKQYRKASIEANKAKKFLEYSERKKYLRIGLGIREYRDLNQKVQSEAVAVNEIRSSLTAAQVEASEWESSAIRLEQSLETLDTESARTKTELAGLNQQMVSLESLQQHEWTKNLEAIDDLTKTRIRRRELEFHLQLVNRSVQDATTLAEEADRSAQSQKQECEELTRELEVTATKLAEVQQAIQADRFNQFEVVRQASMMQSQAESFRTQFERFQQEREQKQKRIEQKRNDCESIDRVLENLTLADADLQTKIGHLKESLDEQFKDRDSLKRLLSHLQQQLSELTVQRSDLRGRIEILRQLEQSQEGLTAGVRELVAMLSAPISDPIHNRFRKQVFGLVADLLNVPREIAPLVDLALGDASQQFIVRDSKQIDSIIQDQKLSFSGRIGFIPILETEPLSDGDETSTLDRWVTCEHPELIGLPRQLLGNVRVVENLKEARKYATETDQQSQRFITRAGELLEPDGTLIVGASHIESGIVSRKSELRDLQIQAESLDREIVQLENRSHDLNNRIERMSEPIRQIEHEISLITGEAGDLQSKMLQHQQQRNRLVDEIELFQAEYRLLESDLKNYEEQYQSTQQAAIEAERRSQQLQESLDLNEKQIRFLEQQKNRQQQLLTQSQIVLAQYEERVHSTKAKVQELIQEQSRVRTEWDRSGRYFSVVNQRIVDQELQLLTRSNILAELASQKEARENLLRQAELERESIRRERQALIERLQNSRVSAREQIESLHTRELALRDLQNHLQTIVDRLKEEYQFDLKSADDAMWIAGVDSQAALGSQYDFLAESLPLEELNLELNELQKKITSLGRNVNLDSIHELEEVEKRNRDLQTQLEDLQNSQKSLLEIIAKINTDSKKLFSETYEKIRAEFQELFRKLFGGGQADVILENPDDVLESGIEILARPPGKELRSISLMSGGEKTMTAVALLLAIFRSKPSPFCLLDEVDAALDEANTTRLASVIRDFLDLSQFIIITHKKRTMSAADVLYGITMQESGVSKQVAIRFEDWPDEDSRQVA